ncbi:hypothetical protein KY311_03525 [Candidatus Woesearchaeota archaeon]|nr:hypothetical protein [Candidatus Woesearchaeota archaeon]
MIPWIMIAVLVIIVLLAVIAVFAMKGKKHTTDYYAFFIIGLIWFPMGIITDNFFFTITGFVFFAIGIANKDKWKKRKKLSQMTKAERKWVIAAIIILGLALVLGLVLFLLPAIGLAG